MNKVTICLNPFESGERNDKTYETEDLLAFLATQWTAFPDNALIYHEKVAPENDVTPKDEESIERLGQLRGHFFVVCWPGDPLTALYVAFAVFAVATVYFLTHLPKIPAARNQQAGSPNNELSARSNRARPNGRIPDIFGRQISTPDLVAAPYSIYVDHKEIEYAYMCIGRGEYEIEAAGIRDGATKLSEIDGASAEVYGPSTSPNSGTPQLTVGSAIGEPVLFTQRTEAVNGQVLVATNSQFLSYPSGIQFVAPNKIQRTGGAPFTDIFSASDTIVVTTSSRNEYRDGPGPDYYPVFVSYNLSGTYTITSVTATEIVLSSPEAVNVAWDTGLTDGGYVGGTYGDTNGTLELDDLGGNWVGPFTIDLVTMENFISNYVSPQGMFKDDGTTQLSTSVEIQLGMLPVDASGSATGAEQFFNVTVVGSASLHDQRAATLRSAESLTRSRYKARSRRLTPRDSTYSGQVSDEVRWKDLYGVAPVTLTDFGNVTTVQTATHATTGALAVKERRLNIEVVRKILTTTATSTTHNFSATTEATSKASDILIHLCLDPYIGNRTVNEIHFYNICTAGNAVATYFGTDLAGEFNYTFDKDNISFEESVSAVAAACFCTAFRRGNVITMDFEGPQSSSKLSFNHRNKLPGTEKRTYTFGTEGDVDGLEYSYIDPIDQSTVTMYIPRDRTATNAKRVQSLGIRSHLQAYFQAYRIYNKLMKQRVAVEYEATQEAELLVRNDRILVADNTRPDTQDGEVVGLTGMVITTSQPVRFVGGHTYNVFLQLTDGTVQSIGATAGATPYEITLASSPTLALSLNPSNFALSTYQLVASDDPRALAFLVTERTSTKTFTNSVKAVNYDAGYYERDLDWDSGLIDEFGNDAITNGQNFTGGTVTLASNGTVTRVGGTDPTDTFWSTATPTTGIGSRYWCRATKTSSGSRNFNSTTWQSLAAGFTYSVTGGTGGVSGILEIASDAAGYTIVATDTLAVNNAL